MSLWPETLAPESDAPARTYVFIVGVSKYEKLPASAPLFASPQNPFALGQVDSPATSAFEIAKWFRDFYHNPAAPLHKIWLLVSPSGLERARDPELNALGQKPQFRASLANAERDRNEWRNACITSTNHVAILYGAGHGVSNAGRACVLLDDFMLRDGGDYLKASLEIGSIATNMVGPNTAKTQLYFSDACRLPTNPDLRGLGEGVTAGGQATGADRRSMALCYSAAPGESAKAFAGKPTLFGQALLACLKSEAWSAPDLRELNWHISIDSLIFRLKSKVEELAKANGIEQSLQPTPQGANATLHIVDPTPKVDLIISVRPSPDIARTSINLRRGDGKPIPTPSPLTIPLVVPGLEPALYSVEFDYRPPEPPFSQLTLLVNAQCPPLEFTRDFDFQP